MTIELIPQLNVAIPEDIGYLDLRERATAACNSIEVLKKHGAKYKKATKKDKELVKVLAEAYVRDSEGTSKKMSATKMEQMSTPALLHIGKILNEFSVAVVSSSVQLRNMITNKLIIETENPDPRVRIRALELLGKISDVGLFTEKREITVHAKSSEELRESLRSKLAKLVPQTDEDVEDAVIIDND